MEPNDELGDDALSKEEMKAMDSFILFKGDNDLTKEKYQDGDSVFIQTKKYTVVTKERLEFQINSNDDDGGWNYNDSFFYNINYSEFGDILNNSYRNSLFIDCKFIGIKIEKSDFHDSIINNVVFQSSHCFRLKFSNSIINDVLFDDVDLTSLSFEDCQFYQTPSFLSSRFQNVNFINSYGVTKEILTAQQQEESYFSEQEKISYLERISKKQEKKIKNYETQEGKESVEGISNLITGFLREEGRWLHCSVFFFFVLLMLIICIEISILFPPLPEKFKIFFTGYSSYGWEYFFNFLPLISILSTGLYFSVFQYSRAKKLRIENENKKAVMHEFNRLALTENLDENKKSILPNFADVIFSKVFHDKNDNKNLPLDEVGQILSMAKTILKDDKL